MRGQGRPNRESVSVGLRIVLETVFGRDDGGTIVEECRRCGTTRELDGVSCPTCGCDGVARYRIE
ncbi:hypothetical protein HTZ84_06955 [Haloterrigena sp. SYSU A558-1]|uniref:Uncharacterized protein n=1 Tax=Haloterrigena gelatinilytica TaxID=2741724 RepID=A0A8J8GLA3_9EURY|nr:hypothetical protein [Haloterrigena gelatinilytica]NUC72047.1 hypothetical protein [Haloterrigena gelatinilytica]